MSDIVCHDVVGENASDAQELRVEAGHNGRQNPGGQQAADQRVGQFANHDGQHGVGIREIRRDDRPTTDHRGRSPNADQYTRHPYNHNHDRVGDYRQAKTRCGLCRHPVLEEMGEHAHAERDENVGEKMQLRDAVRFGRLDDGVFGILFPGGELYFVLALVVLTDGALQLRGVVLTNQVRRTRGPAQPIGDDHKRHQAQDHEDHRLERVRPGCTANAAEENIDHDHKADDSGAQPKGNRAICFRKDVRQRAGCNLQDDRARAQYADEQIGNDQPHQNGKQHQPQLV